MKTHAAVSPPGRIDRWLIALALLAAAGWCWRCWCLFPAHGWNEIRLAPLYWWLQGGSPYPAPATGPSTTWIYGPVPLVLMAPVLLASTAAGALQLAGAINLAVTAAAIGAVCVFWPTRAAKPDWFQRAAVFFCCLAVWPSENLRFFQPDNAAVAFGLWSLLALRAGGLRRASWLSAVLCAAALLCKQTMLGLLVAEVVWLCWQDVPRAAAWHAVRVVAFAAAGCLALAAAFGTAGVWSCLVTLPAKLPWADSLPQRLAAFWPQLALHAGVPAAILLAARGPVWRRDSEWLLPALAWLAAWPFDLAALLKTGGSVNSLHGALLFLPAALTLLVTTRASWRFLPRALAGVALVVFATKLSVTAPSVWRPRIEHLRQAEVLIRQRPEALYFPWDPLVTFYAEGRVDEIEDGLFIRYLAHDPVRRDRLHLPPQFHAVAFRRGELDWGIARTLIPPDSERVETGAWSVYQWSLPPPQSAPAARRPK